MKMRNLLGVMITSLCLLAIATDAYAAQLDKASAIKATKDRMVLMPLRVEQEYQKLQGAMETALVEGLQQKYEVFSGEQVSQKAREIFLKESHSTQKDCDETRCMQNIAEAFNAELIATSNVTKQDGGYFLALSIQNIFDNKVVYSKSLTCENCTSFQVIEKLKELSGLVVTPQASTEVTAAITASDEEIAMWNGVRSTDIQEDYEAYIAQYPNGKFVVLAQSRIKKIQEKNEDQAWQAAEKAGGESDYHIYLNKYSPLGRYVVLAQNRIKKILEKNEHQAWQTAEKVGSVVSYETYLAKYPQGRYANSAQDKIQQLQKEYEEAAMREQLNLANSGYIDSMENVAARYDAGQGVEKDPSEAQVWREKAEAAKRRKIAQEKARIKANKIDSISYVEHTKGAFNTDWAANASIFSIVVSPIATVLGLVSDIISAPFKTTQVKIIENEAALRPSTWGKPDSMIARASLQHKVIDTAAGSPQIIVAGR